MIRRDVPSTFESLENQLKDMEQTIKKITTGQFALDLTVDPNPRMQAYVTELGYKVLIQDAINQWEREIAYPTKDGKKQKRPAGFTRKSIPFTKENADLLKAKIDKIQVDLSENDTPDIVDNGIMDVSEPELYEGTALVPKYREEKQFVLWYLFQEDGKTSKVMKDTGEPRSLETFCATRNIEPVPDAEAWQEDNTFLQSVKEWMIAEKKKLADQ